MQIPWVMQEPADDLANVCIVFVVALALWLVMWLTDWLVAKWRSK
jgi:hypothetical protein